MKTESTLTFEEALSRLEAVVQELESGELSLDQALAGFESGVAMIRLCRAKLDQAEQRVTVVLKDTEGNSMGEEPFTPKEM